MEAVSFNEAPIHESGKCAAQRPESAREKRFNEAPIHESGKFAALTALKLPLESFNEAPIHESGKLPHRGPSAPGHSASMRPRFMNRGSEE